MLTDKLPSTNDNVHTKKQFIYLLLVPDERSKPGCDTCGGLGLATRCGIKDDKGTVSGGSTLKTSSSLTEWVPPKPGRSNLIR